MVIGNFRNYQPSGPQARNCQPSATMQALQGGNKWEVGLGNRMESESLVHRAMALCGGKGDEAGKGGSRCHGVKDLESQVTESGFNSEDHEK